MIQRVFLTFLFPTLLLAYEYAPNEVLVKFKDKVNVSSYGSVSEVKGTDINLVKIPDNKDVLDAVEEFAADPNVEYAQPNYRYYISATPIDTYFLTKLWGLNNTAQEIYSSDPHKSGYNIFASNNPGTMGADIDAKTAWDTITDCSSIVVAVVDTGINYGHEDLINNLWGGNTHSGWNFSTNLPNGTNDPADDNGHGTHVAGIIGAEGNNNKGVTGVCWDAKIMALKAFDSSGGGNTANIIPSINWAVSHGAKIINASFNLYGAKDAALGTAVSSAESAGVLIVSASGNNCGSGSSGCNVDVNITTPCDYTNDNILCVAALDQKFHLTSFSNYGAANVDVAAPGQNIYSTWPVTLDPFNKYAVMSGTSMATPYTVGLAALVWANNPGYTYMDVKNAVMYGGTTVADLIGTTVSGNVINAVSAIEYINVPTGLTATVN